MNKTLSTPIKESQEELQGYTVKIDNYKSSKRLDCLILFKNNTYSKAEDLASDIGISVSTLRRWLNRYRLVGIDQYLKKDTRSSSSRVITPEIHEGLKARLNDPENPFNGFWDAQNWIKEMYGVEVNYKSLWSHITEKLNGSLKIPRKSNIKKNPQAKEAFLKTP